MMVWRTIEGLAAYVVLASVLVFLVALAMAIRGKEDKQLRTWGRIVASGIALAWLAVFMFAGLMFSGFRG
jgi:uncharacterized membrane protein